MSLLVVFITLAAIATVLQTTDVSPIYVKKPPKSEAA
jgi:hypothetical protein